MIVATAIAVAILFGAGAYLLLKRDLIRVVVGVVLMSNAINLFIVSASLRRGRAPIYPLPPDARVADPLVQAMTLTAIVITFGVSALLLSMVYRVYTSHLSLDLDDLAAAEERAAAADDREAIAQAYAREAAERDRLEVG
ncbi:MAG: NADH-quinone oxidoreductase subunit K [Thermomicrobiales bacterium]|nr:NADH-quinone oxidoreductase subunit K [Thermomicrobiales bacterium]